MKTLFIILNFLIFGSLPLYAHTVMPNITIWDYALFILLYFILPFALAVYILMNKKLNVIIKAILILLILVFFQLFFGIV